jgi:hypothetical protein
MLFHGPPGVGKTMLAERVPGLLPDLAMRDSIEVSAVHSLAGFNLADELVTRPPYSDPHHSASVASIVRGGQRMAMPGAISCAHEGVLFLDDSRKAQSIRLGRESYQLAAIGEPVYTSDRRGFRGCDGRSDAPSHMAVRRDRGGYPISPHRPWADTACPKRLVR